MASYSAIIITSGEIIAKAQFFIMTLFRDEDVKIVINVAKKPFKFRENFAFVDMHE